MAINSVSNNTQQIRENELQNREKTPPPKMSESDRAKFDAFRKKVEEAAQSGNMDISSLASEAPDSFKKAVEAHGDTMESAINMLASGKPPQGPEPGKGRPQFRQGSDEDQTIQESWQNLSDCSSEAASSGDIPAPSFVLESEETQDSDTTQRKVNDEIVED